MALADYKIDKKYVYTGKSVSKGTQKKYKRNDMFYKLNRLGNEGFTEYLVSRLLRYSTLSESSFVRYEYCRINGNLGCRSKSFLLSNEEYISINALYEMLVGNVNLADYLACIGDAKKRLDYILSVVKSIGFSDAVYFKYMSIILQLDLLIANTDRHAHNYGLIFNRMTNTFRLCPIFDNGLSLNTDKSNSYTSCTISGSFEEQVIATGYPIVSAFKIDYTALVKDLKRIERTYGSYNEIDVLRERLNKYSSIFRL